VLKGESVLKLSLSGALKKICRPLNASRPAVGKQKLFVIRVDPSLGGHTRALIGKIMREVGKAGSVGSRSRSE
jgi:hypothetical protein